MEPSHKELQRRIEDIVSMIHSFLDKMDTFVPKKSGDMYVKQAMGRELHCHLEMIEMQLARASSALNVGYSIGGKERYHLLESSFRAAADYIRLLISKEPRSFTDTGLEPGDVIELHRVFMELFVPPISNAMTQSVESERRTIEAQEDVSTPWTKWIEGWVKNRGNSGKG